MSVRKSCPHFVLKNGNLFKILVVAIKTIQASDLKNVYSIFTATLKLKLVDILSEECNSSFFVLTGKCDVGDSYDHVSRFQVQ